MSNSFKIKYLLHKIKKSENKGMCASNIQEVDNVIVSNNLIKNNKINDTIDIDIKSDIKISSDTNNKNKYKIKKLIEEKKITETINEPKVKTKKKTIPVTLKRKVWSKWIGEDKGKDFCCCCKLTEISQLNFSCGHIISEFNGGELKIDNLKPICTSCNSSMGTQNMDEYMTRYGF